MNKSTPPQRRKRSTGMYWVFFAAGLAALWVGRAAANDIVMLAASAMIVWAFYLLARRGLAARPDSEQAGRADGVESCESEETPQPRPLAACERTTGAGENQHEALVEQMLAQGRYALLLRPQIAKGLKREQFARALQSLDEAMALVPDGEVALGNVDAAAQNSPLPNDVLPELAGRVVRVQRFFLDRYPVTNRQYYEFVAAGGYEQAQFWDESILPAMLDFVDKTGRPGPQFWREGCYLKGRENQPVVGVNWYEAAAYAAWLGKRLPSDAEWVKAGSWPVTISKTSRFQRRYPWGDAMDRARANLWGSGPKKIVDVGEFAEGVSVGGVYQLIGNVWEWTSDDFRPEAVLPEDVFLEVTLKSIHGGAFDTYFDNQATCQFQSGDAALARRHNIGFRLAIGVCDLALAPLGPAPAAAESDAEPVDAGAVADTAIAEEVTA